MQLTLRLQVSWNGCVLVGGHSGHIISYMFIFLIRNDLNYIFDWKLTILIVDSELFMLTKVLFWP